MRSRNLFIIGVVAFACWTFLIFYLLVPKPSVLLEPHLGLDEINRQIERLEEELQDQIRTNQLLLNKLKSLHPSDFASLTPLLDHSVNGTVLQRTPFPIAVLVFSCNRVTIRRNLDQLIKYRPDGQHFPIIVSQDCGHEATRRTIRSYGDQLQLIQHPDLSDIPLTGKLKKFKGYYKIARHYRWALNQTFNVLGYQTAIIVEDDLDIAPDFFEYFQSLEPVLRADPTLWCVSAWNDNGKQGLIQEDSELLYRSDFFPGLGWMMIRETWLEMQDNWPKAFWDDWVRQPLQRKERACIRPEISRTRTFGKIGVSNGLFYEKHLKYIRLNQNFVPFSQMDLSYLLKEKYDLKFLKDVYGSPAVSVQQLMSESVSGEGSLRVTYNSKNSFKKIAKAFGLMDDFKSGVPRTGYRGVVSFAFRGRRIYLAPPPEWKGYDTRWV